MRQVVTPDALDRLGLQGITSALERIAVFQAAHPELEADKGHRMQRVHARHVAVGGDDDRRIPGRVEQFLGARRLRRPEVLLMQAKAQRVRVVRLLHAADDVDLEAVLVHRRVFLGAAHPEGGIHLAQHTEHRTVQSAQGGREGHAA